MLLMHNNLLSCQTEPPQPVCTELHVLCAAHTIHAIAKKCWQFSKEMQSAVIASLKRLKTNGALQAVTSCLLDLVCEETQVTRVPLTTGALKYREKILVLFSPRPELKAKLAVAVRIVTTFILNADWRSETIQHRCMACCEDLQALRAKSDSGCN